MMLSGNLRKMGTKLEGTVHYTLELYDNLNKGTSVELNELIGKEITIDFEGQINCVVTGKRIKRVFGEGMSYNAFLSSPLAVPSIIRPELSRIHEGVALRDKEWEEAHHNQPHLVYLAFTSGVKVGVTRETNVPFRWMDQGAVAAVYFAETPYRQLAGLIEVEMKAFVADKTHWRSMLKEQTDVPDLLEVKDQLLNEFPSQYHDFVSDKDDVTEIQYPVLQYPEKVKSIKLDKVGSFQKKLVGIKGQYLIFEDSTVMNVRSHAGYFVRIEV